MLGALIIVFREAIEAGIIVGIVLAVTRGVPGSRLMAAAGMVAGTDRRVPGRRLRRGASASALERRRPGNVQRRHPQPRRLHARLAQRLDGEPRPRTRRRRAQLGQEVRSGARSLIALAMVVAVAVMREGSEVALFLYGLVAAGGTTARDLLIGSALGLVAGVALSAVTYFGLATIPPRRLFARDDRAHHLPRRRPGGAGGQLPAAGGPGRRRLAKPRGTVRRCCPTPASFGRVLHTLIGYSDQPSVLAGRRLRGHAGGDLRVDQGVRAARRARLSDRRRLTQRG